MFAHCNDIFLLAILLREWMGLEITLQPIDTSNGGSHQAINEMSIFKVWSKVFFHTTNTQRELTFHFGTKENKLIGFCQRYVIIQ